MRRKTRCILSVVVVTAMILGGCGSIQDSSPDTEPTDAEGTSTVSADSEVAVDKEFTARDLEVGYEDSTATHIVLDGSSIEVTGEGAEAADGELIISDEGTYVITGTLDDGQVIVEAEETDKVQIVLKGVSITCSDSAAIYVKEADKVFITLGEDTENMLEDGKEYVQEDDNHVDGVIFSKSDLTINGNGTLGITGNYQHGIASKDDIVITGGNITITAVKDALNGKDCVKVKDGILALSATEGNGIQSKNAYDATKGYVYICGGEITITECQEGIEGTAIVIEGGTIDITASDDGLNSASATSEGTSGNAEDETMDMETPAAGTAETAESSEEMTGLTASATMPERQMPSDATGDDAMPHRGGGNGSFGGGGGMFENDSNCYISIAGGTINVDAAGDGIDSNGSIYVSGGTTYVSGPTDSGNGGMDYNGTAEITGGTVVVAGSTGMAQGFSDTSIQYSILCNLTSMCDEGTEIKLTDESGNTVVSFVPDKEFQSVVISAPELQQNTSYTMGCGNQTEQITLSSVVTSIGETGMGGGMKQDFQKMK